MTIDEIPAGYVLDKMVSIAVFNGKPPHVWIHQRDTLYSECATCAGRWRDDTPEPIGCGKVPRFSMDIAAAWTVVPEIRKLGVQERSRFIDGLPLPVGYEIEQQELADAFFALEPLSFCRAALKAMGVK